MASRLSVRFRVDFGPRCAIGIGKIQLLEGIASSGSLSQAARTLRMSYRRAWLLLADLNSSFDEAVATSSTGGRGGGGMVLTGFGSRLVTDYRKLEGAIQLLAAPLFEDVGKHAKTASSRAKRPVPIASIKRKNTKR